MSAAACGVSAFLYPFAARTVSARLKRNRYVPPRTAQTASTKKMRRRMKTASQERDEAPGDGDETGQRELWITVRTGATFLPKCPPRRYRNPNLTGTAH